MSDRRLLVIPGLSSPSYEKHKPAYELLREEIPGRGFVQCEVLNLPGQNDHTGHCLGQLSLDSAKNYVCEVLREWDRKGTPYRVLGISFGATVALATTVDANLTALERVIAWGPIPFWLSWRAFMRGIDRGKLAGGTTVVEDRAYFNQLEPVEHLLLESTKPTTVAAGSDDHYCRPDYIEHLRMLAGRACKDNLRFSLIDGCGHNVARTDRNWLGYIRSICE